MVDGLRLRANLTHRQSYMNIAAETMGVPMVALIAVVSLGTMFGGF